jgi:hypothetical protein
LFWFACLLAPVAHLLVAQSRIGVEKPDRSTAARPVLQQNSAARVYARFDMGELATETPLRRIRMMLSQSGVKQNALHTMLAAQQDRGSSLYHHWLQPEEYGARFGADTENIAMLTSWLQMSGMTNVEVARGANFVSFSGSVSTLEAALHVKLHAYVVDGERHYANTAPPVLPESLRGVVAGMQGLDNFSLHSRRQSAMPAYVSGAGGVQSLAPGDIGTIYDMKPLYGMGVDGKGVRIAVVGAAVPSLADYRAYRGRFGLPANDFQTVVVPGSIAGNTEADTIEAALDLEIAGAAAPGAAIVYVQDEDVSMAVAYAIDHRLADVLSISYTGCELPGPEDLAYETLALQGAAEGMTWVSATGDSGAAGCDPAGSAVALSGLAVNLPASLPEVTAVGGTMFAGEGSKFWSGTNLDNGASVLTYVPETAWNGISDSQTVTASGGGVSRDFFKPGFQSSIADGTTGREIPDVAMAAEEMIHPYLVISGGQILYVGGTSAAAPLFAGIAALVNGFLVSQGSIKTSGLGNINPVLYRLQQTAPAVFHDVTTGTNEVACAPASADCSGASLGYAARPGYDMATGLGSVDAYALATDWSSATFASSGTVLSEVGTAPDGSAELRATVTATGMPTDGSATSGSMVFSSSNAGYFDGPATFARVAVGKDGTASTASGMLPGGSNQITAEFEGTINVLGSVSSSLTLNVPQSGVPAASVSLMDVQPEVVAGKYLPLAATVEGTNTAPSGEVSFFLEGSLIGSAPVVDGIAATLSTTPPLPGTSLLTARYGGDGTYPPAVSAGISLIVFAAGAEPPAGAPIADFALTVPSSIILTAGEAGSIPMTLTPTGGFSATVQLTCTGEVTGYSCSVPGTVMTTGKTIVTAKLSTQAMSILLFLPAFFLGRRAVVSRQASGAFPDTTLIWMMLMGLVFLEGCGLTVNKGATTVSRGTYPITITATSGSLAHTAVVNVVLQ